MNPQQFMSNLALRFEIDTRHISDVNDLIKLMGPTALERLWKEFLDTYTLSRPPRRADFVKIMHERGIGRGSMYVYYYHCLKCSRDYSLEAATCPVCGHRDGKVIQDREYPQGSIKAHPQCGTCGRFIPGKTQGASCSYHGVVRTQYLPHNVEQMLRKNCPTCECKVCCRDDRDMQIDRRQWLENTKAGEYAKGWISKKEKPKPVSTRQVTDTLTREKQWSRYGDS